MNFLDLPDEMLLCILNKMNVVDALFSLSDLDDRLNQLLFDRIYVRQLDFTVKSWDNLVYPMNDLIIDRICEKILTRINDKIVQLTVEPHTIERILRVVNYPNVSSLSLMNFSPETLLEYLKGNPTLIRLISQQIRHLNVYMDEMNRERENDNANDQMNIFELIFTLCQDLTEFTFHQWISDNHRGLSINDLSSTRFIHSTLTKLDVQFYTFDDCLPLFDGRFQSLSHCSLDIFRIVSRSSDLQRTRKLPQLKYFSLISLNPTCFYNDLVVPFVQRMINLEELRLSLVVMRKDTIQFVDGNELSNDIRAHLSQLKRFHFSIYTYLLNGFVSIEDFLSNEKFPTNEDIQRSFINNQFDQVESYLQRTTQNSIKTCHVYSMPFLFESFMRLHDTFSDGIFDRVKMLAMNDFMPWESNIFKRINRSFPYLQTLQIFNDSPWNDKSEIKNTSLTPSSITFSHLNHLAFIRTHIDYIENLLFNRFTKLPRLYRLEIDYEKLIQVTDNFTNDEAKFNCSQVKRLILDQPIDFPPSLYSFFPLLE